MFDLIDYKKDKNATSIPWIESPFFYDLLDCTSLTEYQRDRAIKFHEDGYLVLDLELEEEFIESCIKDMYSGLERDNAKFQADFYTYSDSPRLFEEWRESENIRQLCLNKKLIDELEFLYNKEAFPFSTINFIKGSNQPLHSDSIHFNTIPQSWMSGVWIALEDTNTENGTLNIVPGSHKWPIIDYTSLNFEHPDLIQNGEMENYRKYEHFIEQLVETKNGVVTPISLKKGEALIWSANLLHGGMEIKDKSKTRLTQAIHYFYKDCKKYYHPMFSNIYEGKYALKWCNEENNIKKH